MSVWRDALRVDALTAPRVASTARTLPVRGTVAGLMMLSGVHRHHCPTFLRGLQLAVRAPSAVQQIEGTRAVDSAAGVKIQRFYQPPARRVAALLHPRAHPRSCSRIAL